jgi:plasmid stabilization system protein ParE
MKRRISVRPEAQIEIKETALWYESRLKGLGSRFRDELRAALSHIAENPLRFPSIGQDVRRALLNRFPYALYFVAKSEMVIVIAVLSQHRRPGSWQNPR